MAAVLNMNVSHAVPEPAELPERKVRYAYASGSRPLAGYTIKRGVGRGGFGEVYFAVSDAGKEVALKLIRRNLEVELRGVTQCLNLKHPNLIDLYDIRVDDNDDRWVVMEFVSGASLEEMIDRYPEGMPVDMALHWFAGICSGVAYLHDHGIVHRDLKPGNIFLDGNCVKIGDYGLSKFISCSRRSGQTESVGTVHYMAPEIANGRYGKEIDAYALGIMLYEMLTGQVPFEGESVGEVLMKHLTAEPDLSRLDEPFRTIVRMAMAKDPERRVKSVGEMASMVAARLPAHAATFAASTPPRELLGRLGAGCTTPASPASPGTSDRSEAASSARSAERPTIRWSEQFTSQGATIPLARHARKWASGRARPEPIAAAVTGAITRAATKLQLDHWPPLAKALVGFFAVAWAIGTLPEWGELVLPLGVVYLVYRGVRWAFLQVAGAGSLAHGAAAPAESAASEVSFAARSPVSPESAPTKDPDKEQKSSSERSRRPWRRRAHPNWDRLVQQHLASRSLRTQSREMVGALLMASIVACVGALLVCLLAASAFHAEVFVWLWLTATLASWAIIVPGRLADGRIEDQAPLRFTQLLSGALVGCAAWGLAAVLMVDLPYIHDLTLSPDEALLSQAFLDGEALDAAKASFRQGSFPMPLPMYAAWFAFLFVLLRWWRQTGYARAARVSLWGVGWCAFVGYLLSFFWWFPQPLGLLLAGVTSLSIQLASPWMPPSRRRELAEEYA